MSIVRKFLVYLVATAAVALASIAVLLGGTALSSHFYLTNSFSSSADMVVNVPTNMLAADLTYFVVENTPAGCVTLQLVTRRAALEYFSSSADFCISADRLDTRVEEAVSGSYHGLAPDGLIWSRTTTHFDWRFALEFAALEKDVPHLVLKSAHGELLAMKRVSLRRVTEGVEKKQIEIRGQNHVVYMPSSPPSTWNRPIVLVSGSSSFNLVRQAQVLAANGSPVLLVNPVPHLAKNCLSNLNASRLGEITEVFLSNLEPLKKTDYYILVGSSIGATAILLFEPEEDAPPVKRYALSPLIYHLNGSSGVGCMIPSRYWMTEIEHVNYFRNSMAGWVDLLLHRVGAKSQRSVIEETLRSLPEGRLNQIVLVKEVPINTHIFWGADDDQVPSGMMFDQLCAGRTRQLQCSITEHAGHVLTFHPTNAECSAFEAERGENCSKSRSLQHQILNLILIDAAQ